MPYSKKQYSAYGAANETVGKARQVLMLYDGTINFIRKARQGIEEKNIEARFNNLQRACQIILGLQSYLDFENGGKIAVILNSFYTNIDLRLMALNQTNSLKDCDEIIEDLKRMRASWEEVSRATGLDNETNMTIANPATTGSSSSSDSITVSI